MVKSSRHGEIWASECRGGCDRARAKRKKMMVVGFIKVITIGSFLLFLHFELMIWGF